MLSGIPVSRESIWRPQAVRNVLVSHFRPPKEVSMTCLIFRRNGRLQFNYNTEISSVDQQKVHLLSWLHSYLQDCTQQVIINDSLSSKSQVTSGVPDPSSLQPASSLCWWHSSISRNVFSNFNVHCSIQHQSLLDTYFSNVTLFCLSRSWSLGVWIQHQSHYIVD